MALGQDVVSALYAVLLGHSPDEEGLSYWQDAPSVEVVASALMSTERFRERVSTLVGEPHAVSRDVAAIAALRLDHGAGLIELTDLPPAVPPFAGLDAVPWADLVQGLRRGHASVIGRFATQFAAQLRSKGLVDDAVAGTAEVGPVDLLVLTRGSDLGALRLTRPDLIRAVRGRIALPVQLDALLPDDERAVMRDRARAELHACGFAEVRHLYRRRHGGDSVHLDLTWSTPDHGVLHRVTLTSVDADAVPAATWLVADRAESEGPG